jgi:hypothetical protein
MPKGIRKDKGAMDKAKRRIKEYADSLTDETGEGKGTGDQVPSSGAQTGAELMGEPRERATAGRVPLR